MSFRTSRCVVRVACAVGAPLSVLWAVHVLADAPKAQQVTSAPSGAVPASKPSPIPIKYGARLSPQPLTDDQLAELVGEARKEHPAGPPIWFILVQYNDHGAGGWRYHVVVYFSPTQRTERIRRGHYVVVDSMNSEISALIARYSGKPTTQPAPRAGHLHDYVQVSASGERFGADLDVPIDELLPFSAPIGFTDAELIRLVDFARRELPSGQPLLRIERAGEQIEVRSGTQEGPVSGAGKLLLCVPDGRTFRKILRSSWVS